MSRLDEALELLDVAAWLEGYTDAKSGGPGELRLHECPKCGDDRYKLYVNTEKRLFICYVCDWGRGVGDIVQLLAAVSGMSPFLVRAEIASMVVPAPAGDLTSKLEDAFGSSTEAVEAGDYGAAPEIDPPGSPNFTGLTTRRILSYALGRGLTQEDVAFYRLRGSGSLEIRKEWNGKERVTKISGPFLVFPVHLGKKAVAWQGRRLKNEDPKYVSANNIKDWLWPLDQSFFSLFADQRKVVLVEGVFDALGYLRLGIPALCTFGKSISLAQLNILHDLQPKEVYFAWDLDATRELQRAVDRVAHSFPSTYVVSFAGAYEGKLDPGDSLSRPELAPWLRECLDSAMDVRGPEFFSWRMLNA
jgi:DNA primase